MGSTDNLIAGNVRDEQRKFIKYNHLVANILAFHNLVWTTKAIGQLKAEDQEISEESDEGRSKRRLGPWDRPSLPQPIALSA